MSSRKIKGLAVLILIVVTCICSLNCQPAEAEMFKRFKAFNLEQLETLQVKLTYVGPQKKAVPTVAFTSHSNVVDMEKFKPFRRPGFHYGNDDLKVLTFTCTTEELQRVIKYAGEIAAVRQGKVIGEFLSFMMCNTTPEGDIALEAILDAENSRVLLEKIRAALEPTNKEGMDILDRLAQILF